MIDYIATTFPFNPIISPTPLEYDVHVYQSPSKTSVLLSSSITHTYSGWFVENSFYYDGFEVCPCPDMSLYQRMLKTMLQRNGTRYFEVWLICYRLLYTKVIGRRVNTQSQFRMPLDYLVFRRCKVIPQGSIFIQISKFDVELCIASSSEAAFMTGLERNSDIVFAASYAPLMEVSSLHVLTIESDVETII